MKEIDALVEVFENYVKGGVTDSVIYNAMVRAKDLAADEAELDDIRQKLHPYLLRSFFISMAYHKPRGYAGDYQMMQHIYNNVPMGEDSLGVLIDKWCLSRRGAQAVYNRKGMFSNILNNLGDGSNVLGLACGGATELESVERRLNYVGLDMDAGALKEAEKNGKKTGFVNFEGRCDNIIRWSFKSDEPKKYDFIYSAGLIDYFNYGCVRQLLDRCFRLLKKGGELIVGNFAPYEDMHFLTHIMDWKLIYRTKDELAEIVRSSSFGNTFEIISGEEGVNLFAVCTR